MPTIATTTVKEGGKRKRNESKPSDIPPEGLKIVAQFKSPEGALSGPPVTLPADVTPEQLQLLLNNLLQNDDPIPYAFQVDDIDIISNLYKDIVIGSSKSSEHMMTITYQPQAIFKVRTVTRCTSSLSGKTYMVHSLLK